MYGWQCSSGGNMWWKIKALTFLLAATAVAYVVNDWFAARRDAAQLKATLSTQKKVIDAASEREDLRNRDLQSALGQIEVLRKKSKTTQQAAVELQQYLKLPVPIAAVPADVPSRVDNSADTHDSAMDSLALPTKPEPKSKKAIEPSTVPLLPAADFATLYNYVQDCRECELKVVAANANLADAKSQLASLTRERDAALAANHPGIWKKVKQNCFWFALGVGGGLVYDRGFHAHTVLP
jgi:hypothetical protein